MGTGRTMRLLFILSIIFLCTKAQAAVQVLRWPSNTPVQVCQSNDTATGCKGVSGTVTWDAILSPIGNQALDMNLYTTNWSNVSAFTWSGFTNLNFTGSTLTSDSNITTTATMTMGAFNMPTGAVNNYVLTSDGSGNGTWQQSTISGNQSCIPLQTPNGTATSCCVDNSFNWSCSATVSSLTFLGNTLTFNGNTLSFNGTGSSPTSGMTFNGSTLTFKGNTLTFLGN